MIAPLLLTIFISYATSTYTYPKSLMTLMTHDTHDNHTIKLLQLLNQNVKALGLGKLVAGNLARSTVRLFDDSGCQSKI